MTGGVARGAAAALYLSIVAGLMACGRGTPDAPTPEALEAYAARHAPAAATAPTPDPEAPASPPAAPVAPYVRLEIVEARGLENYDGPGKTDAYVQVEWDGRRWETSVVDDSLDPKWGDTFLLPVRAPGPLVLTVWDSDTWSDEKMAVVSIPVGPMREGDRERRELPLRDGAGGVLVITMSAEAGPR